jgi:DNA-binding MarR family transcriptional regulator
VAPRTFDPPPSTGYLIWHVLLRWRASLDRALAPLGLTNAQYGLLASLHGLSRAGTRPSQRELADYSGLEPMYVSKLARVLERAGFVERRESPADPRAVELTLTARGADVVVAAVATVRAHEEERLAPLGGPRSKRSVELRRLLQILLKDDAAMGRVPESKIERRAAARTPSPSRNSQLPKASPRRAPARRQATGEMRSDGATPASTRLRNSGKKRERK